VNDSTAVKPADVHGVARLVIPFVGLPLVWWQRQELLALFLLGAAAVAAASCARFALLAHHDPWRPAGTALTGACA
jgi:hypothetical protein